MPYVNVPNDLSKIKTKMAFNLTKRQFVCFGCARAAEADKLASGEVESNLCFDFG